MVAIKGMEMPTRCSDCPEECYYKRLGGHLCERLDKNTNDERWGKRLDDCPLVEIVTCKNCTKGQRKYTDSKKYCMWLGRITDDDFYCGYGKRKE